MFFIILYYLFNITILIILKYLQMYYLTYYYLQFFKLYLNHVFYFNINNSTLCFILVSHFHNCKKSNNTKFFKYGAFCGITVELLSNFPNLFVYVFVLFGVCRYILNVTGFVYCLCTFYILYYWYLYFILCLFKC